MAKRNNRKHREQLVKKLQYDRANAEDVRLNAMEKLSDTKKRDSSADESNDKPKRFVELQTNTSYQLD